MGPFSKIGMYPTLLNLMYGCMKMPQPAAGENFGGLVVVKLLRDNLVELNLIQLERYNMFRKSSFQPKLFCLKTLVSFFSSLYFSF